MISKQTIIAAMLMTLGLSACDIEDEDPDARILTKSEQEQDLANRYLLAQLNSDKEVLASVIKELKKIDPSVTDAYFKMDEQGKRTMVVSRQKSDGTVETWEAPAAMVEQAYSSANASASAGGHVAASGSSVMPLLGGMLAGYMMANAFNANAGRMAAMSREAHDRERSAATSGYASAAGNSARTMARSGITPPAHIASKVSEASAASKASARVGQSARGSFASSGARAGGYSSGG